MPLATKALTPCLGAHKFPGRQAGRRAPVPVTVWDTAASAVPAVNLQFSHLDPPTLLCNTGGQHDGGDMGFLPTGSPGLGKEGVRQKT